MRDFAVCEGVGVGVGVGEGVGVGVGEGVGDGEGVGVGEGVIDIEGTGVNSFLELFTQTNLLPFITQRNSFPDFVATLPARGQVAPAFTALNAGSVEKAKKEQRTRKNNLKRGTSRF